MHCEQQLDAMHGIPANQRILHVDASGGLCKITKKMNDQYAQVFETSFVFIISK
jgi:hypothetical protein